MNRQRTHVDEVEVLEDLDLEIVEVVEAPKPAKPPPFNPGAPRLPAKAFTNEADADELARLRNLTADLRKVNAALNENVTHVQRVCTRLFLENRKLRGISND